MKLVIAIFTFILLFSSCRKEEKYDLVRAPSPMDTFLVVGSDLAATKSIDTLLSPIRCDSINYKIDIDQNASMDFELYLFYCSSPNYSTSTIELRSLGKSNSILASDSMINISNYSVETPAILSAGDTLSYSMNWLSEDMTLLIGGSSTQSGEKPFVYGKWYGVSNKYIGLLIEDDNNPIYGWIEISVPTVTQVSANIHEVGFEIVSYP